MTDTGLIAVFDENGARKVEIPIDSRFTMYGENFMVHKDYRNSSQWHVTEVRSGAICSQPQDAEGKSIKNAKPHKTKKSAIETAKKNLSLYVSKGKLLETAINNFIDKIWNKKISESKKENVYLKLKKLNIV